MTEATPTTDSVATFYNDSAPLYDVMTDMENRIVGDRPFVRVLVERFGIRTALDAGSGTGMHSLLLGDLGVRVIAVDIAADMLQRLKENARRRGVTIRTLKADLTDLPVKSIGTLDAVFCLGNTLAHVLTVADLKLVMSSFRRVVADKGVLVIHLLNFRLVAMDGVTVINVRERDGRVFRRSYRPQGDLLEFHMNVESIDGSDMHEQIVLHRPWTEKEIREVLEAAGFTEVQWYGGIDLREFSPGTSRDAVIIARPHVTTTNAL